MERDSKSRVNPARSLRARGQRGGGRGGAAGGNDASPCVQSKKMIASSRRTSPRSSIEKESKGRTFRKRTEKSLDRVMKVADGDTLEIRRGL